MLSKFSFLQTHKAANGAIAVIAINHLIGVAGLNMHSYQETFAKISWLNLLISFLLVLLFHQRFSVGSVFALLFAFTLGMAVEAVGVATGFPFGTYTYSPLFGLSVLKVPLIIGINWALLSYCTAHVVKKISGKVWLRVFTASLAMMLLDLLLEPFAIRHGFWVWDAVFPPIQNFASWFAISLPIQWLMSKYVKESTNPLAIPYLVILVLFLITDYLLSALI